VPTAAEAAAALEALSDGGSPGRRRRDEIVIAAPAPRELGRLEGMLERRAARKGGPALVEIVGEPGTGKTSLLQELTWRAELLGAEVVRGDASGAPRPFGVIAGALGQIAALTERQPPAAAGDGAGGRRLAWFAGVGRWLAEACDAFPVVVVLDDLDRADEGSQALVRYLAGALPQTARVLLVVARRPAAGTAPIEGLLAVGESPRIELGPLGQAAAAGLVTSALGRADDALAARVLEHTGGNPLHVIETLRALAERGFPPGESLSALGVPRRL